MDQTQTPNLKVGKNVHVGSTSLVRCVNFTNFYHQTPLVSLGESGHFEVHRVSGSADGSDRLCELERNSPRRVPHYHLDHGTEELRRQEGGPLLTSLPI